MKKDVARKPGIFSIHRVSVRERSEFIANLSLLLQAAVPIGEALQSLAETSRSRNFRIAMEQMRRDTDEGVSLWRSMERNGLASAQTLVLVKFGEASGNLTENLKKAALQEEKQQSFKAKLRSAMLYPTIVLSMTIVSTIGIAWFLLPKLADTFSQLDADLPLITQVLLNAGLFLRENGYWAVPVALGVAFALGSLFVVIPYTRRLGRRMQLSLPGVGKLMRDIEVARFGYFMGTLMNAGLPVTDTMDLMAEATASPQYKKLYRHLGKAFDEGYSFKKALANHKGVNKLLPPAVQQMIIAGERSGSLSESLLAVGRSYEEKADLETKNLQVVMEPILLIIVGTSVLVVMLAVLVPFYDLASHVDGG